MVKVSKQNYIGCLQGGNIGDTLGVPIALLSLQKIRDKYGEQGITDYVGYYGKKGELSDDTQLALYTAETLLRYEYRKVCKGIEESLHALAQKAYLKWLHTKEINIEHIAATGSYDIKRGWTEKQKMLSSIKKPKISLINPAKKKKAGIIKKQINNRKGSGTVMRMASVGLMYYGDRKKAFTIACDCASIINGQPTGYLSAGFIAAVISDLAVNIELRKAIDNAIVELKGWDGHEETLNKIEECLEYYTEIISKKQEVKAEQIEKLGKGWTADEALAMALFASLLHNKNFEKGLLFAVNHSGASDCTGALTGNILGLINGIDKIPCSWCEQLLVQDIVKQMGEDLHISLNGDNVNIQAEWERKYGYS